MLVAPPASKTESVEERLREARACVRQYGEVHTDQDLFGLALSPRRARVQVLLVRAQLWLAVAIVVLKGLKVEGTEILAGGVILAFFGVWIALWREVPLRRERVRRSAAATRVGLGAPVLQVQRLKSADNTAPGFGAFVVSTDPETERHPERLVELASALWDLREGTDEPVPADLREAVEHLRSWDSTPPRRLRLPASFAGNERTWLADVLVVPRHLPRGRLDLSWYPILVHVENASLPARVLPHRFWWTAKSDAQWRFAEDGAGDAEGANAERENAERANADGATALDPPRADRPSAGSATTPAPPSAPAGPPPPAHPKWKRRTRILALVAACVALAVSAGKAALAAEDPTATPSLERSLAFVAASAVLLLLAGRAWFLRLELQPDGLAYHGWLGVTRVPWRAVEALRVARGRLRVQARSRGERVRFSVRGPAPERVELLGRILRRAPGLATLAWCLGCVETEPPPGAELPRRVRFAEGLLVAGPFRRTDFKEEVLEVEGPGESLVVLDEPHGRSAELRAAVSERLLPRLRAAVPPGSVTDADRDLDHRAAR